MVPGVHRLLLAMRNLNNPQDLALGDDDVDDTMVDLLTFKRTHQRGPLENWK